MAFRGSAASTSLLLLKVRSKFVPTEDILLDCITSNMVPALETRGNNRLRETQIHGLPRRETLEKFLRIEKASNWTVLFVRSEMSYLSSAETRPRRSLGREAKVQ